MIRPLFAGALALAVAAPVTAQDNVAPDLAESRLRGCLLAGSSAAPNAGLQQTVVAVRAFCAPQIKRVRQHRVEAATAGLKDAAAKDAEKAAIFALNDEIARAIANFTGLTN